MVPDFEQKLLEKTGACAVMITCWFLWESNSGPIVISKYRSARNHSAHQQLAGNLNIMLCFVKHNASNLQSMRLIF